MEVGSTYANMYTFKVALSQHAIKNRFEFNVAKSGPKRYRVYCAMKNKEKCPWWPFASTTKDDTTVMVKRSPCDHKCSSQRLSKKVKNATKFWICENVKDFLIVDATVGAKELVKKLKEHHGITIPYHRVFHWQSCKRGRKEDIEAMKAIKAAEKKNAKKAKCAQSSIIPLEEDAPSATMTFPSSENLDTTCNKKKEDM